ncbi:Dabb family protein [Aquipuribacter hungaricus]|uniref:Dabb family protein n=1 Tax=Aquipuribacter hungaricus TaxID=545624 RepID=A0ABV7WHE5_9MICO
MITHTVSFCLVHPEGSEAEVEFLTRARAVLSAVPGVQDLAVHRQVSPQSPHRFQLSMRFSDEQAYRAYDEHPEHVRFVRERWAPEVADFQELDLTAWP